jgi:hypothetical protein
MEETTQKDYGLVSGNAVAAKQSPLTALLETQEKTGHLLQVLAERLSPVVNPHPQDSQKALGDRGYHIETALYKQREINEAITYLIDTVVV